MLPDNVFAKLQYLLPQHLLSRVCGYFASCEIPLIKNLLIKAFINYFKVDMSEAEIEDPAAYNNFNAFFTRALKPGARVISEAPGTIACPADGSISEIGHINDTTLLQAKGQTYELQQLLAGDMQNCGRYSNGEFVTIYLSPRDYHRVHMPLDGKLSSMTYVPGSLFSVNQATANHVPGLFARNERLVCHFDSPQGPWCMILVGAMIVAGIETVWAGDIAPVKPRLQTTRYHDVGEISLSRGEEMGRFKLGSTVILLFPENRVQWEKGLDNGKPTRMGESLGNIC